MRLLSPVLANGTEARRLVGISRLGPDLKMKALETRLGGLKLK